MSVIENHQTDYDYTAERIAALQVSHPAHARMLAMLCLAGYRIRCGKESDIGNRWWAPYDPQGRFLHGTGGLTLTTVIDRMYTIALRAGHIV